EHADREQAARERGPVQIAIRVKRRAHRELGAVVGGDLDADRGRERDLAVPSRLELAGEGGAVDHAREYRTTVRSGTAWPRLPDRGAARDGARTSSGQQYGRPTGRATRRRAARECGPRESRGMLLAPRP